MFRSVLHKISAPNTQKFGYEFQKQWHTLNSYNGERHILKNWRLSVILFKFDGDLLILIIGGIQKQEEKPI